MARVEQGGARTGERLLARTPMTCCLPQATYDNTRYLRSAMERVAPERPRRASSATSLLAFAQPVAPGAQFLRRCLSLEISFRAR